jgi:hypothetical protein
MDDAAGGALLILGGIIAIPVLILLVWLFI